eukprot:2818941-Lingulodinium_polyedra.AAC.1
MHSRVPCVARSASTRAPQVCFSTFFEALFIAARRHGCRDSAEAAVAIWRPAVRVRLCALPASRALLPQAGRARAR